MSSLNLRILDETDISAKEVVGRYSDYEALDVLKRYLERDGDLSIGEASKLIEEMLPGHEERDLHFQLGMFGSLTLELGQQIPYSDPAQMRFVRLLQRLQRSYKLYVLAYSDHYPFDFEPGTEEEAYSVNIAAFIARLTAIDIVDGTVWAIGTMKNNLEREHSNSVYSVLVSAAAMWILCAGQWLCNEVLRPRELDERLKGVWANEALYTGPTHGMERWMFWKKAFVTAVESEHATEECKELALRATNLMKSLARDSMW